MSNNSKKPVVDDDENSLAIHDTAEEDTLLLGAVGNNSSSNSKKSLSFDANSDNPSITSRSTTGAGPCTGKKWPIIFLLCILFLAGLMLFLGFQFTDINNALENKFSFFKGKSSNLTVTNSPSIKNDDDDDDDESKGEDVDNPDEENENNNINSGYCTLKNNLFDTKKYFLAVSSAFESPSHVRLSLASCETEMLVHFTVIEKTEDSDNVCEREIPEPPFVVTYQIQNNYGINNTYSSPFVNHPVRIGCVHYHQTKERWHFYVATLAGMPPEARSINTIKQKTKISNNNNNNNNNAKIMVEYSIGQIFELPLTDSSSKETTISAVLKDAMKKESKEKIRLLKYYLTLLHGNSNDKPVVQNFVTVGDLDIGKTLSVFNTMVRDEDYDLFIHLGDASYATNNGNCYSGTKIVCDWNCPKDNPNCGGRDRLILGQAQRWRTWFSYMEQLSSRAPFMTTTGNHDNDLTWFLKFRPPLNSSMPGVKETDVVHLEIDQYETLRNLIKHPSLEAQILANELMSRPYFYSYDLGLVHFIAIGTEDNAINAYERWNGKPLTLENLERFGLHYGPLSPQYKWLEQDLKKTREKGITPWIIVYTHRPIYHGSTHHPMCAQGGDWYVCEFQKLYAPLFEKYKVSLVLSGHSHAYQRTKPMINGVAVEPNKYGIVYVVCGTGGFELSQGFYSYPWLAVAQGNYFGYCRFKIYNETSLHFEHIQTVKMDSKSNTDHDPPSSVFDSFWIQQ